MRPSQLAATALLRLLCCCSPPHAEALLATALVPQLGRGRAALQTTGRLAHPTASGAVSQVAAFTAPTNGTGGSDGGLLLMTSYEATIRLLLDEIAATTAGDQIFLQLYLLEGGASSEAVLAALEEAGAQRGVRVTFVLDVSYVSMLSRLTEKTTTLIPRVEDLATTQPAWCSCTYGSKPDHSKYALFLRGEGGEGGGSSALLGGMNIGDRFSAWRDFVVRLPSPFAEELQASLGLEMAASSTEGGKGRAEALAVVTPLAAAVIFVTLGTFALAPPLAAAATERPWRERLSARGAEGAAQLKARLAALFGRELRGTTLPLCTLFFLMAYVYYGLVLLQPSLVAAALSSTTAPNASAACGAAPTDYAGNVITAAGAPLHLVATERAFPYAYPDQLSTLTLTTTPNLSPDPHTQPSPPTQPRTLCRRAAGPRPSGLPARAAGAAAHHCVLLRCERGADVATLTPAPPSPSLHLHAHTHSKPIN